MPLFDPRRVASQRAHRTLTQDVPGVAAALADRLADVTRQEFGAALWVGDGAQAATGIKTLGALTTRPAAVEGEIDYFPHEPESLDLIVVNGTLHTVNDLPGALVQMRRALRPDGLFLAAIHGGETLHELRDSLMRVESARGGVAARVHPMIDLQTMAGLMQRAGFALPVVDAEKRTIFYRELKTLLRDLKQSGEGLALADRPRRYVGRDFWAAVEDDYRTRHADSDGLLRATIETIFAIGWGPAPTQQQPLRPGSAKHRLADALGSTETALPDRTKP